MPDIASATLYQADNTGVFLTVALLLALSVFTLRVCRRDLQKARNYEEFLFRGKTEIFSLASAVGAVFSVTYFFGATFIYGHVLRGWIMTVITAGLVISVLIINKILDVQSTIANGQGNRNVLLEFLRSKYDKRDFQLILLIIFWIYFSLLVEELAVTRLVAHTLLPDNPAVTTLFLTTMVTVISVYLYAGGFRAVLVSDYAQVWILLAFVIVLIYMISNGQGFSTVFFEAVVPNPIGLQQLGNLFFLLVFVVSWFVCAIDSYSRLNFRNQLGEATLIKRKRFILRSTVLVAVILAIGVIYGASLSEGISSIRSPSQYTALSMAAFLETNSNLIMVVFLVGVLCMIFTTIDTLLVTILQIDWYLSPIGINRTTLAKIVLSAVALSCVVRFDAVSAIGIFIGSLMVLPFFSILRALFPKSLGWWPKRSDYLVWSLVSSFGLFAVLYDHFETAFEWHFYIPGLVVCCTICSGLVQSVVIRSKERNVNG
jgi:Na+/proline symporter